MDVSSQPQIKMLISVKMEMIPQNSARNLNVKFTQNPSTTPELMHANERMDGHIDTDDLPYVRSVYAPSGSNV
jgi:hypothetical protein